MKFFTLLIILLTSSCASRGLKIGQQIPEYHNEYNPKRKMVYAEGKDENKIVYQNVYNNVEKRELDHEKHFVDDEIMAYNLKNQPMMIDQRTQQKGTRGIASLSDEHKETTVYTAPKALFESAQKKRTYTATAKERESLKSLAKKYLGSSDRWYELLIFNTHLVRVKKGDKIKIPFNQK